MDEASLALALALQAEEDEAASAALARRLHDEAAAPRSGEPTTAAWADTGPSPSARTGPLPGERLAGAAHKSIQHLGKATCKKLEAHFLTSRQTLTLAELLRLYRGPRRDELMSYIDSGQRERVTAELIAADLDFPSSS